MAKSCVVYWLFDERCICYWRHGYIGISNYFLTHRLSQHRRGHGTIKGARLVPSKFETKILFSGTISECQALELKLRPHSRIGWNLYRGGHKGSLGYKHTPETRENMAKAARRSGHSKRPKTLEWRAKISAATKARYARPGEREKTIIAVKAAFKDVDRSGANNAMFGRTQSEETKLLISEVKRRRNRERKSQLDLE